MPGKVRSHETDDGYEVLIREDLADEFIATAKVGGYGHGTKFPAVYFVRKDDEGHEDRYVVLAFHAVKDAYGFRRFCRSWNARNP
jgi:hypothetical protein